MQGRGAGPGAARAPTAPAPPLAGGAWTAQQPVCRPAPSAVPTRLVFGTGQEELFKGPRSSHERFASGTPSPEGRACARRTVAAGVGTAGAGQSGTSGGTPSPTRMFSPPCCGQPPWTCEESGILGPPALGTARIFRYLGDRNSVSQTPRRVSSLNFSTLSSPPEPLLPSCALDLSVTLKAPVAPCLVFGVTCAQPVPRCPANPLERGESAGVQGPALRLLSALILDLH